jgi:hypothetical protein
VGSCSHVLSRQTINDVTSRDPSTDRAYSLLKAPGQGNWMPEPVPGRGGRQNGQTGGEILPAHVYHNEGKRMCGLFLGILLFLVGGPSSSARSGGAISSMGCVVPQPFAAGGNQSYLELWTIIGGPCYPGY